MTYAKFVEEKVVLKTEYMMCATIGLTFNKSQFMCESLYVIIVLCKQENVNNKRNSYRMIQTCCLKLKSFSKQGRYNISNSIRVLCKNHGFLCYGCASYELPEKSKYLTAMRYVLPNMTC